MAFRCPECGNVYDNRTTCTGEPDAPGLDPRTSNNELRRHRGAPVAAADLESGTLDVSIKDGTEVTTWKKSGEKKSSGSDNGSDTPNMRWSKDDLLAAVAERDDVDLDSTATKAELVAALTESE